MLDQASERGSASLPCLAAPPPAPPPRLIERQDDARCADRRQHHTNRSFVRWFCPCGVVSLQHLLQLQQALCLDPAQLFFGGPIGEHERLFKLLTQKREIAGPLAARVIAGRDGLAQLVALDRKSVV